MHCERTQTASHIVDQIKSQGLFDKIRKQCLEDIDTNVEYQILQKKVNSFVSEFLENQTWDSTLEKLKLREELRTKLTKTKMFSSGIDKLVCEALKAKMPKGFRNQVQNIVCDYFDISPESLMSSINCDEIKPSVYPESAVPCVLPDINYVSPVVNTGMAIPAVRPPFPYPYPPVPVQHPVIQPNVPCPINAYVSPSGNYMVPPPPPPPPPPGVFCQPPVRLSNQPALGVPTDHATEKYETLTTVHCDSGQGQTHPLEVTVEESVQCDDPMDIESLHSNSPIDQNTTILPHQDSGQAEENKVSNVDEKTVETSHCANDKTAWHNVRFMLDDVSEDEEKDLNYKSPLSYEDKVRRFNHSPTYKSSHAVHHSYDRNSPLRNASPFDHISSEDNVPSYSPANYDGRKHRKSVRPTLEYNPENPASKHDTARKSSYEHLSDLHDFSPPSSSKKHRHYPQTKYSGLSASPVSSGNHFCEPTHTNQDDCHPMTVGTSSRRERGYSKPHSVFHKKHMPYSPTNQSVHNPNTRRKIECRKSSDDSIDRRLKPEYSSSNSISSRFRVSPDSVHTKRKNRRSLSKIPSSSEWSRNESHSPEEHSTSERLTPDPTATSQYGHSRLHTTYETDMNTDFAYDRLTRKREIEARLREIESTERKLLNKQKVQNYEKEGRLSTNYDDSAHGYDYKRLPKKYVK
ncbi:unnamed protein product [Trichobilharzia szidati]|nr:unnamed protein product [Trichobilharzia szidati]